MDGSKARLLATLEVRRNAAWGFAISAGLTLGVLAFFVLIPGSVHPTPYYLALAFVLAMSLGALLTTVLTVRTAARLTDEMDQQSGADHDVDAGPTTERERSQ